MTTLDNTTAIVLAAGKGTRMKTPFAKVLAPLNGKPLIYWVLDGIKKSGIENVVVVVGYQADEVKAAVKDSGFDVSFVLQEEQLGTGHAVSVGLPDMDKGSTTAFVTYGDTPFLSPQTIQQLTQKQQDTGAAVVLTTVILDDPMSAAFGRIIRDEHNRIVGVVEQKVCTPKQLLIKECNAGPVAYDRAWLETALPRLKRNPVSQEYYLTDLVELAKEDGRLIESVTASDAREVHGINTIEHLEQASNYAG